MRPANERWRYNVMSSLIGWAHAQMSSDEVGVFDKHLISHSPDKIWGVYNKLIAWFINDICY